MYLYDHTGRKLNTKQNINNNGGVSLSRLNYNEIGQLKQKSLHSTDNGDTFLQSTRYAYNERGWLKNSSSSQFSISTQLWGNSYANQFLYTYDKLNRLTSGISTGMAMSEILTYDVMGNITSLNRNGVTGNYNYSGNRLNLISGGVGMATGNYAYDANGNATIDGRNGVTLTYNHLNLPKTATKSGLNLSDSGVATFE